MSFFERPRRSWRNHADVGIAGIELRRLRGKPKYLGQFAGGAAPVYRHIRSRWEKWVVENRE